MDRLVYRWPDRAYSNHATPIRSIGGSRATRPRASTGWGFVGDADANRPFPPQAPETAKQTLLTVLHSPCDATTPFRTRWTLATLRAACPWLHLTGDGGLCRLLARLGIRSKRARTYLHSPDDDYAGKVAYLNACWQAVKTDPLRCVLLYLDEFAFERQPSLAVAYEARGPVAPLARLSYRSNTTCRGLGALNALTGQVHYCQRSHITTGVLADFYTHLAAAYPDAATIYVVQDNWPVHGHPNLLARLQPQCSPFQPRVPDNWPGEPGPKVKRDQLPVQLVFLPTYAPWLNPIEKLWHLVRQRILHLHRFSDAWEQLKQRVLDFMAGLARPSSDLLRYVGLLPH